MRKKSKVQRDAEEMLADIRRNSEELGFILATLPDDELLIVEAMRRWKGMNGCDDNAMARLSKLKHLTPAERSSLIRSWGEELELGRSMQ